MLTSAEQVREFKRCRRSFAYFLRGHLYVRTGGGEKFVPWPWQRELAEVLPRVKRAQFLKARQLGMSWELGAYALWVAMFHPGADVLLLSQTEDDAKELLEKIKFAFEMLPEFLKPVVGRDNSEVLEFPKLHSQLRAMPSTERAGRGYTGRLILADEHAHHQWAAANMAAVDPAIDAGGQFLSVSSANGIGNLFHDLWAKSTANRMAVEPGPTAAGWSFGGRLAGALEGLSPSAWLPVFLPYSVRPGREGSWWEEKRAATVPAWLIFQEFPREAREAFVQTGRPVFGPDTLKRLEMLCTPPLPAREWPGAFAGWNEDELRVFAPPVPGHRYVAGADVAEGLEHGDYSDLAVYDVDDPGGKPVEVLTLHGHWDPDVFGGRIDAVARLYPGVYGIERNNHGLAVILECRRRGTPGLYAERPLLNRQGQVVEPGKLGWLTTTTTKPLMIDELARTLRDLGVRLADALAIPELTFYQVKKDGSTGAPAGRWDDRVMARAIAMQMVKHLPPQDTYELPEGPEPGSFLSMKTRL